MRSKLGKRMKAQCLRLACSYGTREVVIVDPETANDACPFCGARIRYLSIRRNLK